MILTYHIANQKLVEMFVESKYFRQWCNEGKPMDAALTEFITSPETDGGMGCESYKLEDFDNLQIMALSVGRRKQKMMYYEPGGS